jgi:hypothetical protein
MVCCLVSLALLLTHTHNTHSLSFVCRLCLRVLVLLSGVRWGFAPTSRWIGSRWVSGLVLGRRPFFPWPCPPHPPTRPRVGYTLTSHSHTTPKFLVFFNFFYYHTHTTTTTHNNNTHTARTPARTHTQQQQHTQTQQFLFFFI